MRIAVTPLALAIALTTLSVPAMAQFQRPDDAIQYRKSVFTIMNNHMGRLGAMTTGRVPFNAEAANESAAVIEIMSRQPWVAFVPGTDRGGAKPEIWAEPDKFKEASERLQAATTQLAAAAKTGNLDSVKTAFGNVDQSCRACHRVYRNR